MAETMPVIQKLRQFGLTRTEAEVYVATLQEASSGPVSSYKVAQAMGRDPANLSKNLAALEKQGAVRLVQEKPKLYLPVLPAEFTQDLVARMKDIGKALVTELQTMTHQPLNGLTLALRDNEQALEKTSELLKSCTRELLIFASRDVIDYLARDFGDLASRSNCRVRFLGVEPSGIALADETIIPMPAGFSGDSYFPWLQMIVDRRVWLTAQFNRTDSPEFPCGWWSNDPAIATVMAGTLEAACQGAPLPFPASVPDAAEQLEESPAPILEPETQPDFEGGVIEAVEAQHAATSTASETAAGSHPQPAKKSVHDAPPQADNNQRNDDEDDDDDDDEGLEFVVRHSDD